MKIDFLLEMRSDSLPITLATKVYLQQFVCSATRSCKSVLRVCTHIALDPLRDVDPNTYVSDCPACPVFRSIWLTRQGRSTLPDTGPRRCDAASSTASTQRVR